MANADRKKCKYLAVVLVDTAVVTSLSFRLLLPRGMLVVVRRSLAQYKAHPVRNLDRALLCKRHSQTVSRASSSTVADTRTGLAGRERGERRLYAKDALNNIWPRGSCATAYCRTRERRLNSPWDTCTRRRGGGIRTLHSHRIDFGTD